MVRDDDKNVVTMASDFQGDVDEFAMVVPVPRVLQKKQIHVMEKAILEHLDAYSAPGWSSISTRIPAGST